ncbi:MAG: hypothetical protein D3912_15975, partial [Candidatus Electrothrix sp. AX1]|nr:hypothetical protein [Candidatus Electrothrix sp. AX1]
GCSSDLVWVCLVGVDLYGYVLGDPVNFVDPDGRVYHIIAGGVIGVAISGYSAYADGAGLQEIIEQAFVGGLIGAISTAIPLGGIIGGFVGELASQRISHKYNKPCDSDEYDWIKVGVSTFAGGLGEGMGKGVKEFVGMKGEAGELVEVISSAIYENTVKAGLPTEGRHIFLK